MFRIKRTCHPELVSGSNPKDKMLNQVQHDKIPFFSVVIKKPNIPIFHHSIIPFFHFPNQSPTFKPTDAANSIAPILSPLSTLNLPIFTAPLSTAIPIPSSSMEITSPGLISAVDGNNFASYNLIFLPLNPVKAPGCGSQPRIKL